MPSWNKGKYMKKMATYGSRTRKGRRTRAKYLLVKGLAQAMRRRYNRNRSVKRIMGRQVSGR